MIYFQFLGGLCLLIFIPIILGTVLFHDFFHINSNLITLYSFGNIIFMAIFQLVSVPYIFMRCSFRILVNTILFLCLCFFIRYIKICIDRKKILKKTKLPKGMNFWIFILNFFIIMVIIGFYFGGMHEDADDAEYVAMVTEAYQNNTLLTMNPYTGESIWDGLLIKRGVSPFFVYVAFYSKIMGIHSAVISHTFFPIIMVINVVLIIFLIGKSIFEDETTCHVFLALFLCLSVENFHSVYTNSSFFLLRLWQGKAVLAAYIIPFFFFVFINYMKFPKHNSVILLFLGSLAGTLTSGISYVVLPLMIESAMLTLSITQKKISYLIEGLIGCIPSLVYGAFFYFMMYYKGVI